MDIPYFTGAMQGFCMGFTDRQKKHPELELFDPLIKRMLQQSLFLETYYQTHSVAKLAVGSTTVQKCLLRSITDTYNTMMVEYAIMEGKREPYENYEPWTYEHVVLINNDNIERIKKAGAAQFALFLDISLRLKEWTEQNRTEDSSALADVVIPAAIRDTLDKHLGEGK